MIVPSARPGDSKFDPVRRPAHSLGAMQVQRQHVRNLAHHRRCEVADTAEIAQHAATAELDVSGAARLKGRKIPAPAIRTGFVTEKLAHLTLNRTRQEPSVNLGFLHGHGR